MSKEQAIIECVPNFSEGRDSDVIKQITNEIESVEGVKLLDVDPGKGTNRTVVTFVGSPEAVIKAAYLAIAKAAELIDMRKHKGEHARMGATDVCPLIPVSGITMEETAAYAVKLAKMVGQDLQIPVYLYGKAQPKPERSVLSVIRSGEYEGFAEKMKKPEWKPDFGPDTFNVKSGATTIGARDFLIAYNINLNTKSTRIANRVAFDVRESGRVLRKGDPFTGEIVRDEKGEAVREPGTCKAVQAVGWFIDEYKVAQVSANLMNYHITPIHTFFDEVEKSCSARGVRITGSELVGLIPLKAMLDAGKYYLKKQGRSAGVSDEELILIAIKSLGLDELAPFDPKKKIIEYQLHDAGYEKLVSLSAKDLANETASDSMAPGGGSIAAYAGALGAALGTMVANLSADKRGWEDQTGFFSDIAEKGQALKDELLFLVDEDTRSFDAIIHAIRMPKETEAERRIRTDAIEQASQYATEIPLRVMKASREVIAVLEEMNLKGNQASISDTGVGTLCVQTAIRGAFMNVMINVKDLKDLSFAAGISAEAREILKESMNRTNLLLAEVEQKLGI